MVQGRHISSSDWTAVGTDCKYKIVNGIAYVSIQDDLATPNQWTNKGTNFPKPTNVSGAAYFYLSGLNGNFGNACVKIYGNGTIEVKPITNSGCYAFFSYPTI